MQARVRGRRLQHGRHVQLQRHALGRRTSPSRAATRRSFAGTSLDWIFGASPGKTKDEEKYAKFDGECDLGTGGMFTSLKFGCRWAEHERDTHAGRAGPAVRRRPVRPRQPARLERRDLSGQLRRAPRRQLPAQRLADLAGRARALGRHLLQPRPGHAPVLAGRVRASRRRSRPFYVHDQLRGPGLDRQRGRALRAHRGERDRQRRHPGAVCDVFQPCPQVPGAITTSAFGSFYKRQVKNTYNDVLPSANLKLDLDKDMVVRFAARAHHGAARLQRPGRLDHGGRHHAHRQRRQPEPEADPLDQRST